MQYYNQPVKTRSSSLSIPPVYTHRYHFVCIGKQSGKEQPPITNTKRRTNDHDNQAGNIEKEEETIYLPVYNDVNDEFLNRHKFSGMSKRSSGSFVNEEPREELKEYKETFGILIYDIIILIYFSGKKY